MAMLMGLVFRGVAFEYRWRATKSQFIWNWSFVGGSIVAAFSQGLALGALVQGIEISGRAYAGGWWDWLTPFSIMTGIAVVVGYALLGATWLNMKTTGALQNRMRHRSRYLGVATLGLIGVVSLWTPFLVPEYLQRWFSWPTAIFSLIVPGLVALCAWKLYSGLRDKKDTTPFLASLAIFVLSFAGIGVSFYPYIVPPTLTIWQAAAPDESLRFALYGAVILIPVILAYSAYSYWVFRGKVDPSTGYH